MHSNFVVLVALIVLHARPTPGHSPIRLYTLVKMRLTTGIVVLAAGAIARAQLSNIPQCSVCATRSISLLNASSLANLCLFLLSLAAYLFHFDPERRRLL